MCQNLRMLRLVSSAAMAVVTPGSLVAQTSDALLPAADATPGQQ
jgi:hypothetical protein